MVRSRQRNPRPASGRDSARLRINDAATTPLWHADSAWADVCASARVDPPPADPDVLVVGAGFSGALIDYRQAIWRRLAAEVVYQWPRVL